MVIVSHSHSETVSRVPVSKATVNVTSIMEVVYIVILMKYSNILEGAGKVEHYLFCREKLMND